MTDSVALVTGISITIVTPALVEVAKHIGLPIRWAGMAAVAIAIALLALGDIALGIMPTPEIAARWTLGGMVYGLAAAGLYSQTKLPGPPAPG